MGAQRAAACGLHPPSRVPRLIDNQPLFVCYSYSPMTSIPGVVLTAVDFARPLLKRGAVAGVNLKQRTLILDLTVHEGNSGGPVWQEEFNGLSLIGGVTQIVPARELGSGSEFDNSGYAMAEPIEKAIDLIQRPSERQLFVREVDALKQGQEELKQLIEVIRLEILADQEAETN